MKTEIIAEIGINHNGDLDVAKKLIDISVIAGCDVVKFQKRNPDICVPDHQKNIKKQTPWGEMTYLEYKHKIEFGQEEYDEIDEYCRGKIDWSASPWDMDSVEFLSQYDLPWVKIASATLTDYELVRECSSRFDKIILSTGMSTIEEIDGAVKAMGGEVGNYRSQLQRCEYAHLHCNSTYPAQVDDLNLSCIKTLDKAMWGSDQMVSVEPHGLIKLVRGVRELERAIGDGEKIVTSGEIPFRDKLRRR